MKERIAKIIKNEQLTSQQFAEIIEIQSSTISHILAGRNLPSFKIIANLLTKYPNISPDWLIFGKGGMYRHEEKPRVIENFAENSDSFTNMNHQEVIFVDTDSDKVSDEEESEDDVALDDLDKIPINQENKSSITSSSVVAIPEKIIVMYSDKTFEIFNSK